MNASGNGRCCFNFNKDGGFHDTYYNIKADENNNSPLTGEGAENKGYVKKFTCVELEVY